MGKNLNIKAKDIAFVHSTNETVPTNLETSHCHDTYEFLFIVDGKGQYILEGAQIPVAPGTLVLARPLEYHCIKIDGDTPYECYTIHFCKDAVFPELAGVFEEVVFRDSGTNMYTALSFAEPVVTLFERFAVASAMPDEKKGEYMRLLFSELIMLLSVSSGEVRAIDDGELGARVIKYLNENFDRNISLDKIAKRFFVSKYYLCRAFKSHNGISVHGYINRKRVMLAKQLIESGETASGAAYRVGFGDYSAFYRAYIKVVGEAPTTGTKALKNGGKEV